MNLLAIRNYFKLFLSNYCHIQKLTISLQAKLKSMKSIHTILNVLVITLLVQNQR